ncbi:MAG: DUF1189 family protein [Aerococcus sp.]|nr:DUF1189 family protein [Aerococcus sp.]
MTVFPLNYLKATVDARYGFQQRQALNWWQMVLVILVLHSFLLLPLSISIAKTEQIDLAELMPKAMASVDQNVVAALQPLAFDDGKFMIEQDQVVSDNDTTFVATMKDPKQGEARFNGRSGVVFTPEWFILSEGAGQLQKAPYLASADFSAIKTASDLKKSLSQQWYATNRVAYNLVRVIEVGALILTNLVFLLFGAALLLYLTHFSPLFTIKTYHGALSICLYALGLPSVVAIMASVFTKDPLVAMNVQAIGFVLMLVWSYWKTHFNDQYVEQQLSFQS